MLADLEDYDRTDYQWSPFQNGLEADAIARLTARQAWQFGRSLVADWSETRRLWPSLELVPDEERERVVDLMQRYGGEWAKLMNERPELRRHFGWPESTAA